MRFTSLLVCFFLLVTSYSTSAQQSPVEFSAEVVTSIPQRDTQTAKIFVGKDRVRTEFDMQGQTAIQIIDMQNQQAYMIDPQQQTYMRSQAGPGDAMQGAGSPAEASPCAGMQNITCKQLGAEEVNGRPAQKWEFENTAQEQSSKMLVWLDEERKMPVRQFMPDGSTMEMKLVGQEKLQGRPTEKWELTLKRPGGKSQVSYQWYDLQLKTNIREEQEGGFTREHLNIKVGPQPAALFTVPAGYSEVSAPQGGAPGE